MRASSISDWRIFGAFVVVTVLLVVSGLSLFSTSIAGFTSEAIAQSLFAYGRHPDSLVIMTSVLFILSLVIAGLTLVYRLPIFAFAFLTIIFAHNGLSFYASAIVTQPLPSIFAESTSPGFLVFVVLSIAFFELSQSIKSEKLVAPSSKPTETRDVSQNKARRMDGFTQIDLLRVTLEIVVASTILGLIIVVSSGQFPNISYPGPLLNVGTNIGMSLRLAGGIFGGITIVIIILRFLLTYVFRWFFLRRRNTALKIDPLKKIHRKELVKYLSDLFSLQKELKYFFRRTPVLIVIPKRRDITLTLLPLMALIGAYVAIGIIFSLGIFSVQIESLRIGYQNSVIPFDSSLYDLEQNFNVSDNVFSAGAEVVGAAVNDFLAEVANAVDIFFRTAIA